MAPDATAAGDDRVGLQDSTGSQARPRRLGVLGWPVAHSRSPAMHQAAFRALRLQGWRYQRLPVPPPLLAETLRALPAAGFLGANVTIPHKEAALDLADEATAPARAIGAVNTLTFAGGRIRADNTDAPGLLAALPIEPAGRPALVLGAGGSARAAVWALRTAGADPVWIWNRTAARAEDLARELDARVVGDTLPRAAVLVHCTSVGLAEPRRTFAELPVRADELAAYPCVVDLVYRPGGTALTAAARAAGCQVVSGEEILVRQGALSFALWTGREPPLDAMRAAVAATSPD